MAAHLARGCSAGGRLVITSLVLLAASLTPSPARSTTVSWTAGFDYAQGPGSRLTRGALAAAGFDFGRFEAVVAGVRYDDRFAGLGTSAVLGIGVPVNPVATLRAQGVRFFADEGAQAWSLKAGPQVSITGRRATFWYSHYEDDAGFASRSGIVETEIPLAVGWTGRANGSYTRASNGASGVAGALGLGWAPAPGFELIGEVGMAETGVASPTGPAPRPLLPFLGSPEEGSQSESRFEPTLLFGLRVSNP